MTVATLEREYGLARPDQIASLPGRDFLQAMIDGQVPAPPIARLMGFEIAEVGDGFAAFEAEPTADLLNPAGTVHGGWALTLIDTVTGCAVHTQLGAGVGFTTVETKGNFSRPITPATGRVRAEARVVNLGRQIATAEAWIKGPDGKLLAHGTSTIMILGAR